MKKWIPQLKKKEETEWLKETYSQCLQSSVINLGIAFKNFFEKRGGYPRFKSRYGKQSLQYPQNVKVVESGLYFPKIGEIKANLHRSIPSGNPTTPASANGADAPSSPFGRLGSLASVPVLASRESAPRGLLGESAAPIDGELKTVTVSKTKTDKYYASLLFDDGAKDTELNANGKVLGIDLGISSYCITSDGSKYDHPRHFKKHERNLKRKQQKLSRKQKGSNSRNKARKLVARAHEKISNARIDFLHKLSRKLVNKSQVIVCENLNIKGMVRNHKLAKAISDAGRGCAQVASSDALSYLALRWRMFLNFLEYKCKKDGKVFLQIDRFFPSSKTCNNCLNVVDSLPLDIRTWDCPSCLAKDLDRDINAAKNCRDEGIRILSCGTRDTAKEGNVRQPRGQKGA